MQFIIQWSIARKQKNAEDRAVPENESFRISAPEWSGLILLYIWSEVAFSPVQLHWNKFLRHTNFLVGIILIVVF